LRKKSKGSNKKPRQYLPGFFIGKCFTLLFYGYAAIYVIKGSALWVNTRYAQVTIFCFGNRSADASHMPHIPTCDIAEGKSKCNADQT